jgi:hypothetical protein
MALITATWRVTHAGVVLLDFDEWSEGEPRIERAFIADRVAVLGGDAQTFLGRGNVSHTASFSRVKWFDNDDEARTYERTHTVSLSDAPADCLIEWVGTGLNDTLEDAVVSGYRAHVESNIFMADYTLTGGDWLTSGFIPPPPPPDGSGCWRLVSLDDPCGVSLQVKNASDVWETVWTGRASS